MSRPCHPPLGNVAIVGQGGVCTAGEDLLDASASVGVDMLMVSWMYAIMQLFNTRLG